MSPVQSSTVGSLTLDKVSSMDVCGVALREGVLRFPQWTSLHSRKWSVEWNGSTSNLLPWLSHPFLLNRHGVSRLSCAPANQQTVDHSIECSLQAQQRCSASLPCALWTAGLPSGSSLGGSSAVVAPPSDGNWAGTCSGAAENTYTVATVAVIYFSGQPQNMQAADQRGTRDSEWPMQVEGECMASPPMGSAMTAQSETNGALRPAAGRLLAVLPPSDSSFDGRNRHESFEGG